MRSTYQAPKMADKMAYRRTKLKFRWADIAAVFCMGIIGSAFLIYLLTVLSEAQ